MVSQSFLLGFLQVSQITSSSTICIDKVRGEANIGSVAEDAVSASLLIYKGLKILENCAKAQFIVRGSIVERADVRSRTEAEDTGVASAGISVTNNSASGGALGARGSELISNTETKRSVTLSLKVVNVEGEVVFAGTQDSAPSKNRSAISEASEKLTRLLVKDLFPAVIATHEKREATNYQKIK